MTEPISEATRQIVLQYTAQSAQYLKQQRRLSIQYGLAAGALALAGIVLQVVWMGLLVWVVFAIWLIVRLKASTRQVDKIASALRELDDAKPQ